jgi:hypothetical protein
MNPETLEFPAAQAEELNLPAEFEFMSVENINNLRSAQLENGIKAREEAFKGHDILNETNAANKRLRNSTESDAEAYVAQHMSREDNPELFDSFKSLVAGASYYTVNPEKWYLGETDEDNNHTKPETSAISAYEDALRDILGDAGEAVTAVHELPGMPTQQEVALAQGHLEDSRTRLAALSVQRRRLARSGSKKAQALETQFNQAQHTYNVDREALGRLQVQAWENQGTEPEQIRSHVINLILHEHRNFTRAEAQYLAEDPTRMAKISRFLASHKLAFLVGSGAVGFGMGYGINKLSKGAVAGAIGLSGAVVLPATFAAGVAVKTTKAVLQSSIGNQVNLHRTHDVRSQKDAETLASEADAQINPDHSAHRMLSVAHDLLANRIDTRVNKDVRSNRNRVIGAMAISGAMGALGFLTAGEISSSWPFEHHAHAAVNPHHAPAHVTKPTHNAQPKPPHHKSGLVNGYNTHVDIKNGEGYDQALSDLANQKHIHLSGAQSWNLYEHLNGKFNGKFLSNDPSYRMPSPGNWGISRPGFANWNPQVLHDMNRWMIEHGLDAKKD